MDFLKELSAKQEKINNYLGDVPKVIDNIEVISTGGSTKEYYSDDGSGGKDGLGDCMDDDKNRTCQEQRSTKVVKEMVAPTRSNDKNVESR